MQLDRILQHIDTATTAVHALKHNPNRNVPRDQLRTAAVAQLQQAITYLQREPAE